MKSKVLLIILTLFLIVACSQTKRLRMGVEEFQNTDWVLEEIDGSPVIDQVQSTIRFQATAISRIYVRVLNFSKWVPSVRPGEFARRW